MVTGWKKCAELYARLASIEALEDLSDVEKRNLQRMAEQAGPPWLANAAEVKALLERSRSWRGLGALPAEERRPGKLAGAHRAILWEMLHAVQPEARRVISELLDEGVTDISSLNSLRSSVLVWNSGRVREQPKAPDPGHPWYEAILDLLQVLCQEPCPFRRCKTCTTIFVRSGNRQLYCSPTCVEVDREKKRKERKRDYMRVYMRQRRQGEGKPGKRRRPRTRTTARLKRTPA